MLWTMRGVKAPHPYRQAFLANEGVAEAVFPPLRKARRPASSREDHRLAVICTGAQERDDLRRDVAPAHETVAPIRRIDAQPG